MIQIEKSRTEELRVSSQRRIERALREQQSAQKEKAEQKARLRALRLAKEAAEREASSDQ